MSDEELDQALGELSAHDVDGWRRDNIKHRAHEALGGRPPSSFARAYGRYFEPAMVTAVCVIHLVWAFGAAAGVLLR
jgi:hypothetical protein